MYNYPVNTLNMRIIGGCFEPVLIEDTRERLWDTDISFYMDLGDYFVNELVGLRLCLPYGNVNTGNNYEKPSKELVNI